MPLTTPRATFRALFDAQPADAFWFAFVYDGPMGDHSLLLSRQSDDPAGSGIARNLKRLASQGEDLGRVTAGVLRVEPSGLLTFSSADAAPGFLPAIERYVRRYHSEQPTLRRLIGARYQQLSPSGQLVNEYKNNEMWSDLLGGRSLLASAQLSATAAVLLDTQPGQRRLFWFTPDTPAGDPMLVVRSQEADDFSAVIARVQGEVGRCPRCVTGFVEVGADGRFTFSSAAKRSLLGRIAALVRQNIGPHPGLGRLVGARQALVAPNGTSITKEDAAAWDGIEVPVLPARTAVLQALRLRLKGAEGGQGFYFDFVEQDHTGAPMLVLTPHAEGRQAHAQARKALTGGCRPLSRPLSGRAKVGQAGLRFRAKDGDPRFLAALERFVEDNRHREATLAALDGSSFTLVDSDGKPLKTHAWAA